MKQFRLQDMIKGWFVGGFAPTALTTTACEVGVKKYNSGDIEAAHYHKIATEVTLVLSGRVRMSGQDRGENDIIILAPGEVTTFEALTDAVTVVVKIPGALNDKFLAD